MLVWAAIKRYSFIILHKNKAYEVINCLESEIYTNKILCVLT
jgi:hypothetical protein